MEDRKQAIESHHSARPCSPNESSELLIPAKRHPLKFQCQIFFLLERLAT